MPVPLFGYIVFYIVKRNKESFNVTTQQKKTKKKTDESGEQSSKGQESDQKEEEENTRLDFKPEVIFVAPSKLRPYDKNAKSHPKKQIDKIKQNIKKNGFDQIPTCDQNFIIITGHGRWTAATELGLDEIPVIVRDDLSDSEIRAKRLADNKLSETDWDDEILATEMAELFDQGDDTIEMTAFNQKEINKLLDIETDESFIFDSGEQVERVEVFVKADAEKKQAILDALDNSGIDLTYEVQYVSETK